MKNQQTKRPRLQGNWINAEDCDPDARTDWLVPGVIPLRNWTAFVGDPCVGKSTVLASYIASLTSGRKWPCSTKRAPTGDTLLVCWEEEIEQRMFPRLRTMRGDTDRLHVLPELTNEKGEPLNFDIQDPEHLAVLERALDTWPDTKLIVFDPLKAFMPCTNPNDGSAVRMAIAPALKMAQERDIALVALMHLNKDNTKSAMQRVGGAIEFMGVFRAAWLVSGEGEDSCIRNITNLKPSLVQDTRGFSCEFLDDDGLPFVEWHTKRLKIDSDEALASAEPKKHVPPKAKAIPLIVDYLEERGAYCKADGTDSKKLKAHCLENGASRRGVEQAMDVVTKFKKGSDKSVVRWLRDDYQKHA